MKFLSNIYILGPASFYKEGIPESRIIFLASTTSRAHNSLVQGKTALPIPILTSYVNQLKQNKMETFKWFDRVTRTGGVRISRHEVYWSAESRRTRIDRG